MNEDDAQKPAKLDPPSADKGGSPGGSKTATESTTKSGKASRKRSSAKGIAIGVAVAVVAVAAAYGVGRLQAQKTIERAESRTNQVEVKLQEQTKRNEQQIEELRGRVRELDARRELGRALFQLEARNFGTAQAHLKRAGKLFARKQADAELSKLAEAILAYQLVATEDIGVQREKVLSFIEIFDRARPPATP